MNEQNRKFIELPSGQSILADELLNEVGALSNHQFFYTKEGGRNKDAFPNAEVHVRFCIRTAVLEERTAIVEPLRMFKIGESALFLRDKTVIGADCQNNITYKGELRLCPDAAVVNELLVEPVYRSYSWHEVCYWNLGAFDKLLGQAGVSKYLLLKVADVMLFSDELTQLKNGKIVTPYHWGGIFGWLMEELDTYAVRNGNLYRLKASLSD